MLATGGREWWVPTGGRATPNTHGCCVCKSTLNGCEGASQLVEWVWSGNGSGALSGPVFCRTLGLELGLGLGL